MPFLIDGNNLFHALRKAGIDAGRGKICEMLAPLAVGKETVTVVFDGRRPRGWGVPEDTRQRVEILFSDAATADDLILDRIEDNTAPKRLVVVSTDRRIRQAARRRRCRIVLSEDFIALLLAASEPAPPRPREPGEKYRGLTEEESQRWLEEFGLGDNVDDEDDPPMHA